MHEMTEKRIVVRTVLSVAVVFLSIIPLMASLVYIPAILAVGKITTIEELGLFLFSVAHLLAWVIFLQMLILWICNKKLAKKWVWLGCFSALVAILPLMSGVIFALPTIICAACLMNYHLS